jgi:hypothetical protein
MRVVVIDAHPEPPTSCLCCGRTDGPLVRVREQEFAGDGRAPRGTGPSPSRFSRRFVFLQRCRRPDPGPGPPGGDRKAAVAAREHRPSRAEHGCHVHRPGGDPFPVTPDLTALTAGAKNLPTRRRWTVRSACMRRRRSRCTGNTEVEEQSRWRWASRRLGVSRSQTVNPSEGPGHAAGPLSTSSTTPLVPVTDRVAARGAGRRAARPATSARAPPCPGPAALRRPSPTFARGSRHGTAEQLPNEGRTARAAVTGCCPAGAWTCARYRPGQGGSGSVRERWAPPRLGGARGAGR